MELLVRTDATPAADTAPADAGAVFFGSSSGFYVSRSSLFLDELLARTL